MRWLREREWHRHGGGTMRSVAGQGGPPLTGYGPRGAAHPLGSCGPEWSMTGGEAQLRGPSVHRPLTLTPSPAGPAAPRHRGLRLHAAHAEQSAPEPERLLPGMRAQGGLAPPLISSDPLLICEMG